MITVWRSDNRNKHDNINKPVLLSITPREREADKLLFMMWVDQSLIPWSLKNIHSSDHHRNDSDSSSEGEGMEVSLGEESIGHRSLETIQSS